MKCKHMLNNIVNDKMFPIAVASYGTLALSALVSEFRLIYITALDKFNFLF